MSEFDAYTDTYSKQIGAAVKLSGKGHDYFIRVKAEYIAEILGRRFQGSRGIRLLDVGCGVGLIHAPLLATGLPVAITGIEVAATAVEVARQQNPSVTYEVYDGEALPYVDGEFDVALAVAVMHHVPPAQWRRFMNEMRRVVRPGGLVVVFEHNPYNPVTARIVRNCPIDQNAVLLPSATTVGLMREEGLAEVEASFILFTPFESAVFKRLDRWLRRLPLGAQYYAVGQVPPV